MTEGHFSSTLRTGEHLTSRQRTKGYFSQKSGFGGQFLVSYRTEEQISSRYRRKTFDVGDWRAFHST
jgi:hypothetical protein